MIDPQPPFLLWWREANAAMAEAGGAEILHGDARYWWEANLSPDTAARLIMQDRTDQGGG